MVSSKEIESFSRACCLIVNEETGIIPQFRYLYQVENNSLETANSGFLGFGTRMSIRNHLGSDKTDISEEVRDEVLARDILQYISIHPDTNINMEGDPYEQAEELIPLN